VLIDLQGQKISSEIVNHVRVDVKVKDQERREDIGPPELVFFEPVMDEVINRRNEQGKKANGKNNEVKRIEVPDGLVVDPADQKVVQIDFDVPKRARCAVDKKRKNFRELVFR
jgi:hypothetical protein